MSGLIKIRRALLSVYDKSGIVELARELVRCGVEIISSGGTSALLNQAGIKVKEVSSYTGFPELLDGRVKTLHPKIHAGLLARRDKKEHLQMLAREGIEPIDMVVVNLYPFEEAIAKEGICLEEVIEFIDIGGPTMLRSAAKNFGGVVAVVDRQDYPRIMSALHQHNGCIPAILAEELALKVFEQTSYYDALIHNYLKMRLGKTDNFEFPQKIALPLKKAMPLRYGENPHQQACLYSWVPFSQEKNLGFKQLAGKGLSYNNLLDMQSAVELIREFSRPAVAFIKHNNPCGVAEDDDIRKAYIKAWQADKLSAFGGIVVLNRAVDGSLARQILKSGFLECIIAPSFSPAARQLLMTKKNLRLIEKDISAPRSPWQIRQTDNTVLVQQHDDILFSPDGYKIVTTKKPTAVQLENLIFAWKTVKHVKSNAIVLAKGRVSVGIGAGQMSRVDAVFMAIKKAGKRAQGSCLASDAFFPKEDAVKLAAKAGVKAIIQPGGSLADKDIIRLAERCKISMLFTGTRHFRH